MDGESIAPPIRVVFDVSKENPIKISRVKSCLASIVAVSAGQGVKSCEENKLVDVVLR